MSLSDRSGKKMPSLSLLLSDLLWVRIVVFLSFCVRSPPACLGRPIITNKKRPSDQLGLERRRKKVEGKREKKKGFVSFLLFLEEERYRGGRINLTMIM